MVLVAKPEGKAQLGRPTLLWQNSIIIVLLDMDAKRGLN